MKFLTVIPPAETLEVWESPLALTFKAPTNGLVLALPQRGAEPQRFHAPPDEDSYYWEFDRDVLTKCLKKLMTQTKGGFPPMVRFRQSKPFGPVMLGMPDPVEMCNAEVPVLEQGSIKGALPFPQDLFSIMVSSEDLLKALKKAPTAVRIGINPTSPNFSRPQNGFLRIRYSIEGDDFQTLLAWLR